MSDTPAPCPPDTTAVCMHRFDSIESELANLSGRFGALPTTSTLALILQYLDGISKRLDAISPAHVVNAQRTEEALDLAGDAVARGATFDVRLDGLEASLGLVLQRLEGLELSVGTLVDRGRA